MAELPTPIPVTKDGVYKATATHDRFGMTVQSWNDPKVITYLLLGIDAPDGIGFIHLDGAVRDDSGEGTRTELRWTDDDYTHVVSQLKVREVLQYLRDYHDWAISGRIGDPPTLA